MRVAFDLDDRIASAAAGAAASLACAAAALVLLRRTARVQAARSALLGRPTAYRLHLHGMGLEFPSWERNFVGECVVRQPPEFGIRFGDDVPGHQRGGSLIRDTTVTNAPGAGFYADLPDPDVTVDETEDDGADFLSSFVAREVAKQMADGAVQEHFVPAVCDNGHEFADKRLVRLRDRGAFVQRTPVGVKCPECGGHAEIAAGHYFIRDGQVVREDIAEDEGD